MKNILKHIALLLVFITSKAIAQTPATITKTNYTATNETLVATESVTIKPTSIIPTGSAFIATVLSDAYIPTIFSNENYIYTRTFQSPMSSVSGISSNKDIIESISYFDGLGRPMQSVAIKASPGKQDIVTHIGYDNFGRQDKDYLPYLATTGAIASYRTGADVSTNSYYISNYTSDINHAVPNPFSQKKFEDSPLSRILLQGSPGAPWAIGSGHEIKTDYLTNTAADKVKLFTAAATWNSVLGLYEITLNNIAGGNFYGVNQLYKMVIKNENWTSGNENTTEEFKDKEGRVILKKTYGVSMINGNPVSVAHETYYVYDAYGNLTYVLPPKADGVIDATVLNNLCYQYKYDNRNRLVEKKLPGKEWEYIVYDKLDRPVLTQDANLKVANKWMFTKYDAFSRPVYTGEYTNVVQTTRAAVQALVNGTVLFESRSASAINIGDTSVNYSNKAFPTSGITPFTITYYDNYTNINLDGGTAAASYSVTPITNAKGLATVSKVRILGTSLWTTNVNYYDATGRSIYTYSKNNYLVATNTVKSQLDFAGKVLETISTHQKGPGSVITITDTFAYDHTGRLLSQKQKINGQTQETILANTYDNLGQLIRKGVGGTATNLQTIDYKYNIRGWLKNINDVNAIGADLFAFQINYNDLNNESTPLFNGNISQTFWKTANVDTSLKSYTYGYDAMNRLTYAFGEQQDQQEIASYDKNGNIMSMYRTGIKPKNTGTSKKVMQILDDLTYTYDQGNKLVKVEDRADPNEGFKNGANLAIEYTYDTNGNMKTDANKGITAITYNYLNLPTQVTLSGGTISYTYDATGIKQRKTAGSITTDYANGFQYENNILQFFPQPEGYVKNNNGVFEYIYQYKDHLGNTRLSYNKSLSIIEENNYYPFGLKQIDNNNIINSSGNAAANKYKYNGKEFQDELQLNVYDYGARNYDPAIGRWMNIDPLAETSRRFSPYTYALDNPVYYIDPDGMMAVDSDPPNTRIISNQVSNSFKYDDKGETKGTDKIQQAVVSTMTITDSNGQAIQTMDSTTLTTAYVDAEGNASKTATITSTNSINTKNEDGSWTRTNAITAPAQTVSMKETSKEMQATVKEVSTFKSLEKISPVQAEARENAKENKIYATIGGSLGTAGRAIASYIPHPATKVGGGIVAGLGGGIASIPILTQGTNPTNPENIYLRKQFK
jgi:RHS repeat-associated protein